MGGSITQIAAFEKEPLARKAPHLFCLCQDLNSIQQSNNIFLLVEYEYETLQKRQDCFHNLSPSKIPKIPNLRSESTKNQPLTVPKVAFVLTMLEPSIKRFLAGEVMVMVSTEPEAREGQIRVEPLSPPAVTFCPYQDIL